MFVFFVCCSTMNRIRTCAWTNNCYNWRTAKIPSICRSHPRSFACQNQHKLNWRDASWTKDNSETCSTKTETLSSWILRNSSQWYRISKVTDLWTRSGPICLVQTAACCWEGSSCWKPWGCSPQTTYNPVCPPKRVHPMRPPDTPESKWDV